MTSVNGRGRRDCAEKGTSPAIAALNEPRRARVPQTNGGTPWKEHRRR
jgi:hypothetical protein